MPIQIRVSVQYQRYILLLHLLARVLLIGLYLALSRFLPIHGNRADFLFLGVMLYTSWIVPSMWLSGYTFRPWFYQFSSSEITIADKATQNGLNFMKRSTRIIFSFGQTIDRINYDSWHGLPALAVHVTRKKVSRKLLICYDPGDKERIVKEVIPLLNSKLLSPDIYLNSWPPPPHNTGMHR